MKDILRVYQGTLVEKVMNEEVVLREMIRQTERIDFSTHHVVAITKCKQQANIMATMLAKVGQQIEEEAAIKEVVVMFNQRNKQ